MSILIETNSNQKDVQKKILKERAILIDHLLYKEKEVGCKEWFSKKVWSIFKKC